jgi:hypothetical protein
LHIPRAVSLRRDPPEVWIDPISGHARIDQRQVRNIELDAVEQVEHLGAELQLVGMLAAE